MRVGAMVFYEEKEFGSITTALYDIMVLDT